MKLRMVAIAAGCALMMSAPIAGPRAQDGEIETDPRGEDVQMPAGDTEAGGGEEPSGAVEDLREAASVIRQMKQDEEAKKLLQQAQGVFVIPDYATAALIAGVSGGEGVLITKQDGEWSNPAFYDIGGLSIGAQAGAAAGSIVMVLVSDDAVQAFKKEDTSFALTADAGLSIINWSAWAQGDVGREGDVVLWTDVEGLMGAVAVGVEGVSWDDEENAEYYGRPVTMAQIFDGSLESPHDEEIDRLLSEVDAESPQREAMGRDGEESDGTMQ
jgi:SH3 domain-containing YSC84-like protein 1